MIGSYILVVVGANFWIKLINEYVVFRFHLCLSFSTHKWFGRNILLFGSEGFGLNNKTLEHSDFVFKIDINKKVESLNIANSVSVVCHYIDFYLKQNK